MSIFIPIAPNVERRDSEEAIKELHAALMAVNTSMEALAKMFPGVTALTGFIRGEPCLTLAFATSREADHFSPPAMNAAKTLAQVAVAMLPELQEVFLIELRCAAETRRIKSEMAAAVAGALRARRKECEA